MEFERAATSRFSRNTHQEPTRLLAKCSLIHRNARKAAVPGELIQIQLGDSPHSYRVESRLYDGCGARVRTRRICAERSSRWRRPSQIGLAAKARVISCYQAGREVMGAPVCDGAATLITWWIRRASKSIGGPGGRGRIRWICAGYCTAGAVCGRRQALLARPPPRRSWHRDRPCSAGDRNR